jgi:hypothetical protein
MAMRLLLPVAVDPSLQLEEGQNSANIVLVSRAQLTRPSAVSTDTTYYPKDSFVWSVARGGDGSFNFYSAPVQTLNAQRVSDQSEGAVTGEYVSAFPWAQQNTRQAAAQYWFCANMLTTASRPSLNVYA